MARSSWRHFALRGAVLGGIALSSVACASAGGSSASNRAAPASFAGSGSGSSDATGTAGRAAPRAEAEAPVDLTAFNLPLSDRQTLVVLDFDYSGVSSSLTVDEQDGLGALVRALRGDPDDRARSESNLGAGIADLVVNQVLETGQFRVLERRQLEALQREQSLAAAGPSSNGQASLEHARLMGAKYALVGSVTRLGSEETSRGIGGGGRSLGRLGGAGFQSRNTVVGLTARVVDTETGEVLLSVTSEGNSDRGGGFVLGGGSRGGALTLGSSTSNVRETAIGEATDRAVLELVHQVAERWQRLW
jgi:curli biogenesis system outer membrane secretion channel CsgG